MDTLHLRKLAKKSVLNFGQYSDLSVQQLLSLSRKNYLRWCYYNCSMISFVDEVLNELNIDDKWKIEKPGTNAELGNEFIDYIKSFQCKFVTMMSERKRLSHNKQLRKIGICRENVYFKKSAMQSRNHGHI